MPSRQCPTCRHVVPSSEYEAHRLHHVRQNRERKGSTRQWRNTRELIFARDGHRCTYPGCLATENLEVDHIDGDWRNNAPSNLRTRCFPHNPRGTQRAKSF